MHARDRGQSESLGAVIAPEPPLPRRGDTVVVPCREGARRDDAFLRSSRHHYVVRVVGRSTAYPRLHGRLLVQSRHDAAEGRGPDVVRGGDVVPGDPVALHGGRVGRGRDGQAGEGVGGVGGVDGAVQGDGDGRADVACDIVVAVVTTVVRRAAGLEVVKFGHDGGDVHDLGDFWGFGRCGCCC